MAMEMGYGNGRWTFGVDEFQALELSRQELPPASGPPSLALTGGKRLGATF